MEIARMKGTLLTQQEHAKEELLRSEVIKRVWLYRLIIWINALVCVSLAYTQAKKQQTNQYILQPCVVKTVGVTGKISKWQLENRLQKCFHCPFSKTQVFHRSTDEHQWELSLLLHTFRHQQYKKKTVKVNGSAN